MAKHIDAVALIKKIFPCDVVDKQGYAINAKAVYEAILKAPAADVVEVVRCKDCVYKTVTIDGEYDTHDIVCGYFMSDGFDGNDFCSYGKKENE